MERMIIHLLSFIHQANDPKRLELGGASPSSGLQLSLTSSHQSSSSSSSSSYSYSYSYNSTKTYSTDTVVMQNLGYFQLQVPKPTLFDVAIHPSSPHAKVFAL